MTLRAGGDDNTVMAPRISTEELEPRIDDAPADAPLLLDVRLHDSDPEELVSARLAADLIRLGYRAIAFEGGIAEWIAGKLPIDSQPAVPVASLTSGSRQG